MDDEVAPPRYVSQFGQLPECHSETEGITSLAWPDRFFPFLFVTTNKNGKKRSGHARLGNYSVSRASRTVLRYKRRSRQQACLSSVGGKTYSLLRDLLALDKPSTKTLDELFTALKTHYAPQPIVIAEHFYFHKRNQAANESIADYLAALCQLATHCLR